MNFLTRTKPIEALGGSARLLKPTLRWPHLVALGVGAIVGTGIYTLTGICAGRAGPAVILAFAICGVICACAALCYAEMSTMMPVAGSAYTYSYAVLGELVAWIIGWSLVLEYTVAAAAVAVGWSAHVSAFLGAAGWSLPAALSHGLFAGGVLDLPAIIIGIVVTALLVIGTRESATINLILVCIKLAALVLFVGLAATTFDPARFHPFAPYGFGAHVDPDGVKRGVLAAAAIIFFAFYGFDAVSTAAEETINPARDLTIGIIGSMVLCTVIYIAVAAAALGASSYMALASSAAPLVHVLELLRHPLASQLVAAAAIVALPTVILVLMYGQSRIWYVMARDGLLPQSLAALHKTRGTPVVMTLVSGVAVIGLATTLPLANIALLANAGTLAAFIAVALSVLMLRIREPERARIFRAPLGKVVAVLCIAGCVYLFASGLPGFTQIWFVFWNAIGLVVYFAYGAHKSRLAAAGALQ